MKTTQTEPRAVQLCHELLVWTIPLLKKIPRNRWFTLGERIESGLLSVLSELVEASDNRNNKNRLQQANRQLAVVRHGWLLGFELNTISSFR